VKPFDYGRDPRACTTYRIDFDAGRANRICWSSNPRGRSTSRRNTSTTTDNFGLARRTARRDLHGPGDLFIIDEEKDTPVVIKDGARLVALHPRESPVRRDSGGTGRCIRSRSNADDFEADHGVRSTSPRRRFTLTLRDEWLRALHLRAADARHATRTRSRFRNAHSNVESDEVLYYVARQVRGGRRGVEESSFTLHPHGIPHGPAPPARLSPVAT